MRRSRQARKSPIPLRGNSPGRRRAAVGQRSGWGARAAGVSPRLYVSAGHRVGSSRPIYCAIVRLVDS